MRVKMRNKKNKFSIACVGCRGVFNVDGKNRFPINYDDSNNSHNQFHTKANTHNVPERKKENI